MVVDKLHGLGVRRTCDLICILNGDIQLMTAALHPAPVILAFKLKEMLTSSGWNSAIDHRLHTPSPRVVNMSMATTGSSSRMSVGSIVSNANSASSISGYQSSPSATVPLVVTIKMNGKVLAERTTLPVLPNVTWEGVARTRLEAVFGVAEMQGYASMPLAVNLFPNANHLPSDHVSADINDTVAGAYALGYPHVLLTLSPPVYGCARPAARGVDAPARMMSDAVNQTSCTELPDLYQPKQQGGKLDFELSLFNALRAQCERDGLGVRSCDKSACNELLLRVRDALWLMAGREVHFKCSQVCLPSLAATASHIHLPHLISLALAVWQMPTRFCQLSTPIEQGGYGICLSKKPQGSLSECRMRLCATRLRTALDVPSFARSSRWETFRDDVNQLHSMLLDKANAMREQALSAAERREANITKTAKLRPKLIKPNLVGTPAKFATLELLLRSMRDYEVLMLPEEKILQLHPLSEAGRTGKTPENARRVHIHRWRNEIGFKSIAIEMLEATWGSQLKLILFVWRVPLDSTERELPAAMASHTAAITFVEKQLPEIHGRYARQQFVAQYSQITGVSRNMLGHMYALLTSDGSAPVNSWTCEAEKRVVEFVASRGDVELWPDLRALNGNDGTKYNLFWDEGDKYLAELETLASGNRHGQQRSLQQPLSVPDFIRQVERRLCDAGHHEAPIPSVKWVAFQFHPRRPTSGVATRYTGRWAIKLQVLQMTLRKDHPDAHWCNALEKYIKAFIREFDVRLVADLTALDELRAKMECLHRELVAIPSHGLSDKSEQEGASESDVARAVTLTYKIGSLSKRAFADRAITTDDLKGWLQGESCVRVARLSDDTKCKIPVGEPGARVSTAVRPSGPAPSHLSVALAALDHGWHRASITPSVTLRSTMPDASDANQSWRRGPLTVRLYDSTFQAASAFRNSTEMLQTIDLTCSLGSKSAEPAYPRQRPTWAESLCTRQKARVVMIVKRTDGGPEQNMKNGSVKLADIGLLRTTGADLLLHSRPAPDNSWLNDVEGCMPVLNLGLQHMALERGKMDPKFEELLKNAGSMRKTRETVQAIGDEQERLSACNAWKDSMSCPIKLLGDRFNRLFYNDQQVKVIPPATAADIKKQHAAIKAIDPSWEPHMTTQAAIANCPLLCEYLTTHVLEPHKYLFIVAKCGDPNCKFGCKPLRMPRATFDWLKSRPRVVPFPMHRGSCGKDHFAPYEELKAVPTTEAHLPSYEAPKEPPKEAKAADKAKPINFSITNYARAIITCADCSKPRVLFASKVLTPNETSVLEARLDSVIYTCGACELFDDDHPLKNKVFVKSALVCGMPVEKSYYSAGKFPLCCSWCGEVQEALLVELSQLDLGGKKGYPICTDCHGRGLEVVTHGQSNKMGAHTNTANKAKGRQHASKHKGKKAARKPRQELSDEEEGDEEEDDEEEEEEGEGEEEVEGEEDGGAEAEAAQWGSAAGQLEEGIWAVERVLAKEERGAEGIFYLVDWAGWSLEEATWEPLSHILTANTEVRNFEETLAAMPRLDAFDALSPSGCCFGKLCKFGDDHMMSKSTCASCGREHHHLCALEHPWLKWIGPDKIEGRKCFDCWLLEAQLRKVVHRQQVAVYYKQLTDWSRTAPSPFAIGAILAFAALTPQAVVMTTQRTRLPPASSKCKVCKSGGDGLLACNFCPAVYHNSDVCLGDAQITDALAASSSFLWACPACFKKGVTAVQRVVLKPAGQRMAGVRKPRKRRRSGQ